MVVIYGQIIRSVKDFPALFVASAFMANLFLQLAGTLRSYRRRPDGTANDSMPTHEERNLNRVKPVFFVHDLLHGRLSRADYPLFARNLLPAYAAIDQGLARHDHRSLLRALT